MFFDVDCSKSHDAHHEFFNCDYGFLGLCDWIFGTSHKWKAKRAEVTKRVLSDIGEQNKMK